MEYRLPHINKFLKQLCIDGVVPRSSPRAKSIQSVMEMDGRLYPDNDDSGYLLTQDLHQDNLLEVGASPFGYHHHHLPDAYRREFSCPEGYLYDCDNLLPVPRVGVFLPLCCTMSHPEVFGPHS